LSGPLAVIGLQAQKADQAYVDVVNKAGGIAGRQIQLIVANDQDDPATGVSVVQRLVSQGVVAFLNSGYGSVLAQEVAVLDKAKIPVITAEATTKYGDPSTYPYFFTTYPLNSLDGATIAKYLKGQGLTKVGVISDGTPYGKDLVSGFQTGAGQNGVTVASVQTYSFTAVDVTTQLKALQGSGAQALVVLAETGFNHIFDGIRQIGWNVPIVGGIVTYSFADSLGALGPRTVASCAPGLTAGQQPSAALAAAQQAYLNSSGSSLASPASVLSQDAVYMLKYAIEKENSTSGPAIKAGLETIQNKSFMDPSYAYTYTSTSHAGWAGVDTMCKVVPLGPDSLPIRAG
jgi:branched-chain amino acid transport system substrate-binding protein